MQVLACGGEIVWVVGHEVSETAKITETTEEVIELTWTPGVQTFQLATPV